MLKVNNVVISGRSCDTPQVRDTPNSKVCTVRLAHNEREKRGDEWVDVPVYIDCDCWGKRAEYAEKNVSKGTILVVEGKLRLDTWEKDGQKRQKIKIWVTNLQVDKKASEGATAGATATATAGATSGGDDLPF